MIYSTLVRGQESYRFAKGTIVIQAETVTRPRPPLEGCVSPDAAVKFKDAIADFNRLLQKPIPLERQFQIQKPYLLVSSATIQAAFAGQGPNGWNGYMREYPGSAGFIELSPIGFNKDKTQAFVWAGSSCGGLCGRWSYYLIEKIDGRWRSAPGITCSTMS